MIQLETNTIKLRAVEPTDANLIYQWENDTEMWDVSGIVTPYSMFQIEQYIASEGNIYQNEQVRFMIDLKSENTTIGTVDLFDFDPLNKRAGLGILIYPNNQRGKGYATEAIGLVKQYAFTILDLHQLHCTVNAENQASLKCMQKSGFTQSGIKKDWTRIGNNWIDVVFMQCFSNTNNV